jgi:hypothetical protein
MSAIPLSDLARAGQWQEGFLRVLPAIQTHAEIQFRRLSAERRADAIQEAIASACVSYQILAAKGRLHVAHPATLANYAVKRAGSGRHVGGHRNSQDVMSLLARRKHGFSVRSLSRRHDSAGMEPLVLEERGFGPADVAAFNIDFADWLRSRTHRERRIIRRLASGDRTTAVADRFGLSLGRVSQLRRQFEKSWEQFTSAA